MIGNDIVDLAIAEKESNWKRKGFLDKIFTKSEQKIILSAENPGPMVWILWSCKESAYKIYNRESLIRAFIPLRLECSLDIYNQHIFGMVKCFGNTYLTKTQATQDYVYTIAVKDSHFFARIKEIDSGLKILKNNGIPFLEGNQNPISITHHGRFEKGIELVIN